MKKLFLLAALFATATFSSCSHDDTEPIVVPAPQPLTITFAEGNSLEFEIYETKIIHYTITGGGANNVVKAEMWSPDDAYTVVITPISATHGTIAITAKKLSTVNRLFVTVSNGSQTITAGIAVSTKSQLIITVETPGKLSQLLAAYPLYAITKLTIIGNLNDKDIAALKNLPNLSILDMENANLEVLPAEAFKEKESLTSVKLPKTLKTIGDSAFKNCSGLTSVTIPDSVTTIGKSVFSGCSGLTSITIPNSVTSIGDWAFSSCSGLKGVYITDIAKWCAIEFTNYNSNPLYYAHNLYLNGKLVTELVIPDGVTSIGSYAFRECSNLTSVTIPDGVTIIGERAFNGCSNLTSVTIPDGVTTIGMSAFSYCSSLTSITIPDSVTTIGNGAFESCNSLISVTIPDGVTTIENVTFENCISLKSVTIPDSVTEIGEGAFGYCRSLTSITIPNGVRTIKNGAFIYCSGLTSIYCKAQRPPSIASYAAFNGVNAILYVPTGCKAAYAAAYQWKNFEIIIETEF